MTELGADPRFEETPERGGKENCKMTQREVLATLTPMIGISAGCDSGADADRSALFFT
jgi:hypothetical protein